MSNYKKMISPKRRYLIVRSTIFMEKPETQSNEAEGFLKTAEFDFMIDSKTLIHKRSNDPKLLQLKICVRNKQKERSPRKLSPVFNGISKLFGLLFAAGKIVIPEELKKSNISRLTLRLPGFNENAWRKEKLLVVRNEEGHREQVQYKRCVHGLL